MEECDIPYLTWYANKSKTPEWIFDMVFFSPPPHGAEHHHPAVHNIVVNAPLFAYDYSSSMGQRALEEQLVAHSAVTIKFGLSTKYHIIKALMCNETMVELALIKLDGNQKTMRTLIFGQCNILRLKEYNGEVMMSLNYNFCGDSIKTDAGVSAMDWSYDEYAGTVGSYKNFAKYLENKNMTALHLEDPYRQ